MNLQKSPNLVTLGMIYERAKTFPHPDFFPNDKFLIRQESITYKIESKKRRGITLL